MRVRKRRINSDFDFLKEIKMTGGKDDNGLCTIDPKKIKFKIKLEAP